VRAQEELMKRMMAMLIPVALAVAVQAGCKKEEQQMPAEPAETKEAEKAKEADKAKEAEKAKAEATKADKAKEAEKAKAEADKACQDLYAATEKAQKASKKKAKAKLAPKDKFLTACKELPAAAIPCLDPAVAKKEDKKCKEAIAAAEKKKEDKEKLDAVRKMLE